MTNKRSRGFKTILVVCALLMTVGVTACNEKKIDPGVMKTQFGIQVFKLVKQLNKKEKLDPAWDLANKIPELAKIATEPNAIQVSVTSQKLDPFNGEGTVVLMTQGVTKKSGGSPFFKTMACYETEWEIDEGRWVLVRGKKLK